jgi:glycosyltransferase involved in cell wall biosynthesis
MKNLAIVIPAYKIDFFEIALQSISNQTCNNFTLYIGDDASNQDLKSIVDRYSGKVDIRYKRFDKNLGGIDLVAHWNRCLELTGNEEWCWLFSDDDIMSPFCVENFYDYQRRFPDFDIFHFDLVRINEHGERRNDHHIFPDIIKKEDLLIGRLEGSLQTTVVEYIFLKKRFIEEKCFQNFDLAWGSDDATWIKIARFTDIKHIPESSVFWRYSAVNISNQNRNGMHFRKMKARIDFAKWLLFEFKADNLKLSVVFLHVKLKGWFNKFLIFGIETLRTNDIEYLTLEFYSALGCQRVFIRFKILYFIILQKYIKLKSFFKYLLKHSKIN